MHVLYNIICINIHMFTGIYCIYMTKKNYMYFWGIQIKESKNTDYKYNNFFLIPIQISNNYLPVNR